MCAIFGSKQCDEFLELAELNEHRGGTSYSIMGFDKNLNINNLKKHNGTFNNDNAIEVFETSVYAIGHVQSPTDGVGSASDIHPAHCKHLYMYHNGIVKTQAMSSFKNYRPGIWDTELILREIADCCDLEKTLSSIDGSFACALIDAVNKKIQLFTNKTCQLHIDRKTMSISSMMTGRFKRITPNIVFEFNPITKIMKRESKFNNLDDIYFIPSEDNINDTNDE